MVKAWSTGNPNRAANRGNYLVILLGLRAAGKREIGQMTVFDLGWCYY